MFRRTVHKKPFYTGTTGNATPRSAIHRRRAAMTAPNITLLGVVGDAAGMLLRKVACAEPDCADAVRICRELSGCDTVEHQLADFQRNAGVPVLETQRRWRRRKGLRPLPPA